MFEDDGIVWHGNEIYLDYTPKNVPNGTLYTVHAYFDDKADKYYVSFEKNIWLGDYEYDDDEEWGYETTVIKSAYLDEMSDMFKTIGEYIDFAKQYKEP